MVVALGVIAMVRPVSAAKLSITLSPTKQEIELIPKQTTEGEITIKNKGEVAYGVRVFTTPYTVDKNYENVFDKEGKYTYLTGWIRFLDLDQMGEAAYWLEPGTEQVVRFAVDVPFNAPGGGQYASIMAEVLSTGENGGVSQTRQVASLLYGRVDGKTERIGEVINRQFGFWYGGGDMTNSLVIKNTGNVDFMTRTTLIVRGLFGSDKFVGEPQDMNVMPETERQVEMVWKNASIGLWNVTQRTEMNGQIIEETKTILVLPIWLMILFVVVVAGLISFIIVRKKLRRGRRSQGLRA